MSHGHETSPAARSVSVIDRRRAGDSQRSGRRFNRFGVAAGRYDLAAIPTGFHIQVGGSIHVLITALHAFHNRTGSDMTHWFGQHQVATKVRRQARLALAA